MDTKATWYVYIIENRLKQYYIGVTNDPMRRIAQHRGEKPGGAKALRGKAPLRYRFVMEVDSKSAALKAEYALKQLSRRQKDQIVKHQCIEAVSGQAVTLRFTSA